MTIVNENKNILGLLGQGLKFEVVCGIGFLINFHATLDLAILDLILNIPNSRLLILFDKLNFGGPYCTEATEVYG
jgi:hypothetical protein